MTANYQIIEAISQLIQGKQVEKDFVLNIIKEGLITDTKRKFGKDANIKVEVDPSTGGIQIFLIKTVVKRVTDKNKCINIKEAKLYKEDIEPGEQLEVPIPFDYFGRNAVQTAKQIIIQKMMEAEKESIYQTFSEKIGSLVTGTVQQIEKRGLIVNIGKTEALISTKDLIPKDSFHQNSIIKAIITDVQKNSKGPHIFLSRTHNDFLLRLMELEIPELYQGILEVIKIAREPGERSKVAVQSNDKRVDPIGACIGIKGNRIVNIIRELQGEKIDIIPYSPDIAVFLIRALAPAKVSEVIFSEDEKKTWVIVPDDQLSVAVGKNGINVRLASKLTDLDIEILKESEAEQKIAQEEGESIPVETLKNLPEKVTKILLEKELDTVGKILKTGLEGLLTIEGLNEESAKKLLEICNDAVKQLEINSEEL